MNGNNNFDLVAVGSVTRFGENFSKCVRNTIVFSFVKSSKKIMQKVGFHTWLFLGHFRFYETNLVTLSDAAILKILYLIF
jgi:uncharacterized C2H2 Zn-finger protein